MKSIGEYALARWYCWLVHRRNWDRGYCLVCKLRRK